jgi:hexosaminidase
MPALVPRPTEAAFRPGHFMLDDGTTLRFGAGAEPAAELLRTLLTLGGLGDEGYVLAIDSHAVPTPPLSLCLSRKSPHLSGEEQR